MSGHPDHPTIWHEVEPDICAAIARMALALMPFAGLPDIGAPQLYIDFDTRDPEASIPPHILSRFPHTLPITLQHTYRNLWTNEDEFGVELAFSGQWAALVVPFRAIRMVQSSGGAIGFIAPSGPEPARQPATIVSLASARRRRDSGRGGDDPA